MVLVAWMITLKKQLKHVKEVLNQERADTDVIRKQRNQAWLGLALRKRKGKKGRK
jgi:hypothetical protein